MADSVVRKLEAVGLVVRPAKVGKALVLSVSIAPGVLKYEGEVR